MRQMKELEWSAPLISLAVITLAFALASPHFRKLENFYNIGLQTSVIAIIAVGQTLVIIAGGIDLSVGSVLAVCGVNAALLMSKGVNPALALVVGVITGAACGFVNGFLSTKAKIPPFIATLGMMGGARGLALLVSGSRNIFIEPSWFGQLGGGRFLGLPFPFIISVTIATGAHLLLTQSRLGRHIYAIGGNREASRLAGVAVERTLLIVFTLCGLTAGIAGMVETSRLTLGQPTGGQMYELHAIAAAVIGGSSLSGGRGTIVGTIIGAFIMSVLRNGCNILNVSPEWQLVLSSSIVALAAWYDQLRHR